MTRQVISRIFDGMDCHIRLSNKSDAPAFYGISLRAHTASYYDQLIPNDSKSEFYEFYTWSQAAEGEFTASIIRKIEHPEWFVAVAETEGQIIGYTIAHLKADGRLLLRGLFVDPASHAKGIGTALFNASLDWGIAGMPITLSVLQDNVVAKSIYEKRGFRVAGVKSKDFFGAKMITMQRIAD